MPIPIPKPAVKVYPENITENSKVKKLWNTIVKKYNNAITSPSSVEEQWLVAVTLFDSAAIAMGYVPFDFEKDKTMITKITRDMDKRANKIKDLIDAFALMLDVGEFIRKWSPEKFKEVTKNKNLYNIYTERRGYIDNLDDKESLIELIKDHGFKKQKGMYVKKVNNNDQIIMRFTPKFLYLYPNFSISEDHAKLITHKRDESDIKESLKEGMENWIKSSKFRIKR